LAIHHEKIVMERIYDRPRLLIGQNLSELEWQQDCIPALVLAAILWALGIIGLVVAFWPLS
jgi:hypothetical protein